MLKAREILRLKHDLGFSLREIGNSCNCGKSTVSEVLERAKRAKIVWPTEMSDKQLMSLLYPPMENKNSPPEPDMDYVFCEMKKKSVTLMLLWEEYKAKDPDGIMYTQFCERYRNFKKVNAITMHKEHKAGEVKHLLESREYPVQTYRACMGIMRLAKTHSNELMERASREAIDKKTCSFKYFSIILKQLTAKATTGQAERIITHDNVRGSSAFTGGGINA